MSSMNKALKPSDADANEGLEDVLGHDIRVAGLSDVLTVHIPGAPLQKPPRSSRFHEKPSKMA